MRVFHGLQNIAGIPAAMAAAERKLGIDSTSVCFPSGTFNFQPDIVETPAYQAEDLASRFRRYADEYDVFVFHFGNSLAHDTLADIPLLKQRGKSVIMYFHGCDIRQSKETIRKYRFSACKECWPQNCSANRDHATQTALRFADEIWVSTPDLLEFVPSAKLFLQPINLSNLKFEPNRSSAATLKLVHAPSSAQLKGTRFLSEAIQRLNPSTPLFDFMLLEGLAHTELLKHLGAADIGVDQLLIGSYGVFSIELMALGVPVICYIRDDLLNCYPEPPPVINANPDTIYEVLRTLQHTNDTLTMQIQDARRYVETYHNAELAAQRSIASYQAIEERTAIPLAIQ